MDAPRTSSYCVECGPVQTSHLILWLDGVSDALTFRLSLHRMPLYSFLMKVADGIVTLLGQLSFFGGRALGLVTLSDDIQTSVSDRSRFLWEEALRRSLPMQQMLFLKRPTDTFRVRHNGKSYMFTSIPLSVEASSLRMDDKVLFKKAMEEAGLPVPKSRGVSRLSDAQRALAELSLVCVKPRTGSNGRHTYPYVRTEEELKKAFGNVQQICPFVSVEEHLEGNLCRATCVDGKLIGFLESSHPHVVGDGVSTINELVAQANAQKIANVDDLVLNGSLIGYINRRGYEPTSVLPEGVRLQLSYRGGSSVGQSNREHGRNIHPSFIGPIEEAARVTKLPVVGFDLIIPDPMLPASEQRWGFIEANSLPWIDLHNSPYYGEPIDLAPAVWDLWMQQHSR